MPTALMASVPPRSATTSRRLALEVAGRRDVVAERGGTDAINAVGMTHGGGSHVNSPVLEYARRVWLGLAGGLGGRNRLVVLGQDLFRHGHRVVGLVFLQELHEPFSYLVGGGGQSGPELG